jgi:hypothetical protein
MSLRKITTRTMIVAAAAMFFGLIWAVTTIRSRRSAPISDRHGIRAWLLIPKGLRDFPVEEYVKPGDHCLYTILARPRSLTHWRLRINTAKEHREHWERALSSYAMEQQFEGSGSHHRGANRMYTEFRVPNGDRCWLLFEEVGGPGDLDIDFIYHVRPPGGKLMKYMYTAASHIRKFCRFLRGEGLGPDSITRAS